MLHEADFYEVSLDRCQECIDTVICRLCPHACRLKDGQTGRCGTRTNHDGRLYADNYAMVSSLALDPIEKKPLKKFMPGSSILSVGSYGCNFHCPFCQNHEIAQPVNGHALCREISPEELVEKAIELQSRGNIGLAYTYNEPITWYETVLDTAALIRHNGLKNVMVTNGFICEQPLRKLLPLIDAMNIDLKAFDNDFYYKITGGNLETVKNTIKLASNHCHIEVTTLVISGLNDSPEQMAQEAAWLAEISPEIPLHISRFFPQYKMLDRPKTPAAVIYELQAVASKYLRHVYTGNV